MSEQSQHNDSLPPAPAEQDVVALIKKMQQQLVFLEKKIDILINQSQERPFGEKRFSKPFRSFDRPHRYDKGERDNSSRPFRSFGHSQRHGEEDQRFGQKKKPFFHKRRDKG